MCDRPEHNQKDDLRKRSPEPPTPRRKKRYHPPSLVVYGDLRKITMQKLGSKGDGTGLPKTRM
jgi:hypothetical protein